MDQIELFNNLLYLKPFNSMGTSGGVMVSKLGKQTYTSEYESHWVLLSYGLVPHLSKKLSKFPFNSMQTELLVLSSITWNYLTECKQ